MNLRLIDRFATKFTLKLADIDKIWTYAIYDSKEQLVFMWNGSLKEINNLSPFRANEKFNTLETYTIVLIQASNTKIESENALNYWIINSELNGNTPEYNLYNKVYNDKYFIQCLENGKFYRTGRDVVRIFGVVQSALSNHLRGVTGYKSVRGLHFKFYGGPAPKEIEIAGGWKMQEVANGGYATVPSDDPINNPNLDDNQRKQLIARLLTPQEIRPW